MRIIDVCLRGTGAVRVEPEPSLWLMQISHSLHMGPRVQVVVCLVRLVGKLLRPVPKFLFVKHPPLKKGGQTSRF